MGSYALKSILRGRVIIQRGAIWRIRSGEKINIWQRRWLPRKHPPWLLHCPIESFENHSVDSLIDPITRSWNEEMVDGLFGVEDAEMIKKIPFGRSVAEDTLYWPYFASGHYTCRSGYRFLKEESELLAYPQAPPVCDKKVWKAIWKMQVLPKIRNFIWRACRNALPTKQALMRWKIVVDPICERCKLDVEDAKHALWSCLELDVVWADQVLWNFRQEVGFSGVKDLLSWMVEKGTPLEQFAFTAWSVWSQRNKVRLNLQSSLLHQVAEQARTMFAQYQAPTRSAELQLGSRGIGRTRWSPPQVGFVKINFDGAVFDSSHSSGVGAVIRNHNGAVMAFCAEKLNRVYRVEEIEAVVALKALQLASNLGFQKAILEGDSLGLIKALEAEDHNLSPWGLLLEDVKLVANSFVSLSYSHIKRNGNNVAHNLVKHAIRIPNFEVWMEDVSSHVVSFLHSDVVHLP